MSSGATTLVRRIWAYDASVWTGADEDQWLGWLDVVTRMRTHVDELKTEVWRLHGKAQRVACEAQSHAMRLIAGDDRHPARS